MYKPHPAYDGPPIKTKRGYRQVFRGKQRPDDLCWCLRDNKWGFYVVHYPGPAWMVDGMICVIRRK